MYFSLKYPALVALLYSALRAIAGPIQYSAATTELESFHTKRAGVPRKRGLLFGGESSAQQTTESNLFTGSTSQVAWASNYGQTRGGIVQYIGFVPTIFDLASGTTNTWAPNLNIAITQGGSKYAMYLNEPDQPEPGQSQVSPAAAAAGFKQYMQPFAGKIKLGGPAISGAPGAFTWLSQFYAACSGCTIDFQPFHCATSSSSSVASAVSYIESYTNQAISASGRKPV